MYIDARRGIRPAGILEAIRLKWLRNMIRTADRDATRANAARLAAEDEAEELRRELDACRRLCAQEQEAVAALTAELEAAKRDARRAVNGEAHGQNDRERSATT